MNWGNLLWLGCAAAHTAAATFSTVLELAVRGVEELGPWTWLVPAVCLTLLVLDQRGQGWLRGTVGKVLAAVLLPLQCAQADVLLRSKLVHPAPPVWGYTLAPLALAVYVLLREKRGEDPLEQARALLEQGSALSLAGVVWLYLIAGAVVFMATFGLLLSMIVGSLIASRNGLLDYEGMVGLLAGLLSLYGFRTLWYVRGLRWIKKSAPELDVGRFPAALLFPFWGERVAHRLTVQIQLQARKSGEGSRPAWEQY